MLVSRSSTGTTLQPMPGEWVDFVPYSPNSGVGVRAQSDANGVFATPIVPGMYRVIPERYPGLRYPQGGWQVIRVLAGEDKQIVVYYN
jgi:hypothetical protein